MNSGFMTIDCVIKLLTCKWKVAINKWFIVIKSIAEFLRLEESGSKKSWGGGKEGEKNNTPKYKQWYETHYNLK